MICHIQSEGQNCKIMVRFIELYGKEQGVGWDVCVWEGVFWGGRLLRGWDGEWSSLLFNLSGVADLLVESSPLSLEVTELSLIVPPFPSHRIMPPPCFCCLDTLFPRLCPAENLFYIKLHAKV